MTVIKLQKGWWIQVPYNWVWQKVGWIQYMACGSLGERRKGWCSGCSQRYEAWGYVRIFQRCQGILFSLQAKNKGLCKMKWMPSVASTGIQCYRKKSVFMNRQKHRDRVEISDDEDFFFQHNLKWKLMTKRSLSVPSWGTFASVLIR